MYNTWRSVYRCEIPDCDFFSFWETHVPPQEQTSQGIMHVRRNFDRVAMVPLHDPRVPNQSRHDAGQLRSKTIVNTNTPSSSQIRDHFLPIGGV